MESQSIVAENMRKPFNAKWTCNISYRFGREMVDLKPSGNCQHYQQVGFTDTRKERVGLAHQSKLVVVHILLDGTNHSFKG